MKVVIIAAGKGNRLWIKTNGTPKTLLPFAGGTVLSTIINNFMRAGLTRFVLVLGYQAEVIEHYIKTTELPGAEVEFVFNPDWHLGNGISVQAAHPLVGEEPFILSMSDHLVTPSALKMVAGSGDGDNTLLVDRRVKQIFDIDDATKVLAEGKRIVKIGKELSEYNAIDCGIFKLTTRFFTAMQNQRKKGKESISAGIQELIRNDDMQAVTIGQNDFWIDVDTPEAYHHAQTYFKSTH